MNSPSPQARGPSSRSVSRDAQHPSKTFGRRADDPAKASSARGVRVVIADHHHFFRRGLRDLLSERGLLVVGEASTGADAAGLVAHAAPDVAVVDLAIPRVPGIDVVRRVTSDHPETAVLILTVARDEHSILEAIDAGARGYLLKDAPVDSIVAGIHAAAAGESLISPAVAATMMTRLRGQPGRTRESSAALATLTDRELEVLRLIAEGQPNRAIASTLTISPLTVKRHLSAIFSKLGVENRIQAAVMAVRAGVL